MKIIRQLFEPGSHLEDAVFRLCVKLNVPVTRTSVQKELISHPGYPSLLSVSDVLKLWFVDNISLSLPLSEFQKLSPPFLIHIKPDKVRHDLFALVEGYEENAVSIYHPEKRAVISLNAEELAAVYKGSVLLAEPKENAGEKQFTYQLAHERKETRFRNLIVLFLPVVMIMAGTIYLWDANNIQSALFPGLWTISGLLGTVVCCLLLLAEVNISASVTQQICGNSRKMSCEAVLHSKGSKIFGISWSTIGFTYFTGSLLFILSNGLHNHGTLFLMACLSGIVLPFPLFSLAYQWRVVKQWCVLCLMVQAVLIGQFILAVTGGFFNYDFSTIPVSQYISLVIWLSTVFVFISAILWITQKISDAKLNTPDLIRLKRNPEVFKAMLSRQKKIVTHPGELGIIIGNPAAKHRIIKVCNPFCGPCAKAHSDLEDILRLNPEVCVQVIFTATGEESDVRTAPVRHLLAIASKESDEATKEAMDQWYNAPAKNYERFAEICPIDEELKLQDHKIQSMRAWCDKEVITHTPTIFVNNFQLPDLYKVNDLKYLLTI